MIQMATKKQVETCRTLFRKVKLYYRTLKDDAKLRDAVLKRTQYDLDDLEHYEALEIIDMLSKEADKQREGWRITPEQAAAIGAKEAAKKRGFPTMSEVESADHLTICRWYRFLPSAEPADQDVQQRIYDRFNELGGFTPEISKSVGWTV